MLSTAALTAAIVFSGVPAASAAQAKPAGAPMYIVCKVKPNNPHNSHGKHGWIVGKSQFWCNAKIDSLVNTVKLQKKVKGHWKDVTKPKSRAVSKPEANVKYRNQARNYKCRAGTFRTASKGHGVYRGVPSKSRAWQYSEAIKNPCK
ncbi:hypothetical protein [Streptomyces olivaceiscleroticus]|uniref:Uncharacterized protein n=1 Tax=Streptomyces olivaceiscleroticus TaxID=68245 RepID=A0ABN1AFY5_9ACTN